MAQLITFAGIDGAGKSTQAQLLAEWLQHQGLDARFLAAQSSRPVQQLFDRIAFERGLAGHVDLLGADVARLLLTVVKWTSLASLREQLAKPQGIVVTDRGAACQYAVARCFAVTNESLLRAIFEDLQPPLLTLYLALPGAVAAERVAARGVDSESAEALDQLDAAYRSLPEFPEFEVIDATADRMQVQHATRKAAARALGLSSAGTVPTSR